MRKYFLILTLLLSLTVYSQIAIDVPQITRPTPSYNGIANFNEVSVNTFTGVPDISIPIASIPTRSKDVSVDLGMKYHPSGVSIYNGVSDVGMGWNLFGGGQITRKIIGKPDKYCTSGSDPLCDNQGQNTDEYNYSFMGFGGRFKVVKDPLDSTYKVQHMDLTPLQIEFTLSSSDNTISSFTVYDTKGYQYVFGVKNRLEDEFKQGRNNSSLEVCSDTYQITQVKDNNNNVLVSYQYEDHLSTNRTFNKLKTITVAGYGSVTFNFTFTSTYVDTVNDPFQINEILVKDANATLVKRVTFDYEMVSYVVDRRMLTKVRFWETGNTQSKDYSLQYNPKMGGTSECPYDYVYDFDNYGYLSLKLVGQLWYPTLGVTIPQVVTSGVLKTMVLPSGGAVDYEFESNTRPFDPLLGQSAKEEELRRNPLNTYMHEYESYFYLANGSTTRQLVVTGTETKELYFKFWHEPYDSSFNPNPGQPLYPKYRIVGQNVNFQFGNIAGTIVEPQNCYGQIMLLDPGTYTIEINAILGADEISGHILVNERALRPDVVWQEHGAGLRIKNIRYFDGIDGVTKREQHYDYAKFSDPSQSSGELFEGDWEREFISKKAGAQMGYTNVTVSTGVGNGYSRHTYLSKDEPVNLDQPTNDFKNYLGYKAGLLKKAEVFDNNNRILNRVEHTYLFEHLGESFWVPSSGSGSYNYKTKLSWPKLITRESKSYTYNGSTANETGVTESFTYHANNREIDEHVVTMAPGDSKKTKYYYHTGNSIHSKNRISELEKTETYRGTELLSTSSITYSNTFVGNVSYLPQTIQTSKGSGALEIKARYQAYDQYGNPTQVRAENGLITSYIWGYNKTLPIAKIDNMTNASIATATGVGFNSLNESHITTINNIRTNGTYSNAQITTYIHKPLVGITSVTDPRGDKMSYDYDTFNRLKWVKDKDNNFLSEHEYYYRQTSWEQNYIKTKNYKTATTSSLTSPLLAQALESITYYDGLGRTIQQISKGQTPSGKDIIAHVEYDSLGRQTKRYLPFASTQNTMAYMNSETLKANIISQYQSIYGEGNPLSETRFENSPLNRVLEQAAPGDDWAMNNSQKHTIRFDYQTNAADEVKLYKATASWSDPKGLYDIALTQNGTTFYDPNQLYKTITKDENWKTGDGDKHTTQEFKDKEGRVVLKRSYGTSVINDVETAAWHETYYVYDQFGNLTYVIPPLVEGTIDDEKLNGLCYQYKYDHRNRLVEKKLPGKQWEFIVYDKLDRVVMSGPALSPFGDGIMGWMITKYDVFSRPILTAWIPATVTNPARKTQQQNRNTATVLNESKSASNTTINGVGFRYTTTALPTSGYHVLTVNYYDDYDTGLTFTPAISYSDIHGQALLNNTAGNKPVGMPTVSWVRVPETATLYKHEKSYILYDKKGRVVRTFKNNYLTGYLQTDQKLQPITGRVDFTETRHKRLSGEAEIYTKDVFTYTDQDRLLSHTHQIGTSGTPQLLAKNEYDELGQLISKQVGGTDVTTFVGLQKVDYRYNIRGWLKSINDVDNLSQGGSPTDLFAFKLNYNQVENALNYTGKALYNGNISETYWRTSSDNVKRKYGYFYDELNRLKDAVYQKPNATVPVTNSYNESLTYDKNGNVKRLFRNGEYDDAGYFLEIDKLKYIYHDTDKNKLIQVIDEVPNPNGFKDSANNEVDDYKYDDFGNMESDANKGITRISYNHLNLPIEITFAETKHIRYLYNATGQKISKTVTDGSVVTITEYLDGYQYIKPGADNYKLHFFPHAEGYVNTIGGNNYVFNYTDHLGNIRLSYGLDRGVLTILEENNYYPFGLKHDNYNITKQEYDKYGEDVGLVPCVNCAYKYKYNGKELQDELGLNFYDYGARNYDPAIGRWMNIDPLAESDRRWTPYRYAYDNPLSFIDSDGNIEIPAKDAKRYSKLTNYLKNGITEITSNRDIMSALSKYGGFSETDVKKLITTYGSGIRMEFYDRESIVFGPNGYYGDQYGSSIQKGLPIHLARDMAQTLEDAVSGSLEEQLAYLSVLITILHESTHYGDVNLKSQMEEGLKFTRYDAKGYPYIFDEMGKLFEIDAFWDGNAGRWLKGQNASNRLEQMKELLSNKNCNDTLNSLPQSTIDWIKDALKENPNIKIFIY